jgi:2,3-bisphosphoglycerate-dependent phosphoglycerate mutase
MGKKHIFLIRHGESTANIDTTKYSTDKNHNVSLTELGHEQAVNAGKFLKNFFEEHPELKNKKIRFYYSPFLRAQQTKDGIVEGAGNLFTSELDVDFREEASVREREYGGLTTSDKNNLFPVGTKYFYDLVSKKGGFYARPPYGESLADASVRVDVFKDKLMSSMERNDIDVAVIVSHSEAILLFEKQFFHYDVNWLEKWSVLPNGGITLFKQNDAKGFTNEMLFENKKRSDHLPPDYKTAAYNPERNKQLELG